MGFKVQQWNFPPMNTCRCCLHVSQNLSSLVLPFFVNQPWRCHVNKLTDLQLLDSVVTSPFPSEAVYRTPPHPTQSLPSAMNNAAKPFPAIAHSAATTVVGTANVVTASVVMTANLVLGIWLHFQPARVQYHGKIMSRKQSAICKAKRTEKRYLYTFDYLPVHCSQHNQRQQLSLGASDT